MPTKVRLHAFIINHEIVLLGNVSIITLLGS